MFQIRNILEIDPGAMESRSPEEQKALLAMRATKLFVDDDTGFEEANARLMALAKSLDEPATMTYEDVVIRNASCSDFAGMLYVLSDDPHIAAQEAEFYKSHKDIEISLGRAVSALFFMNENRHLYGRGFVRCGIFGGGLGTDEVTAPESLTYVNNKVRGLYRDLDPQSFNSFRPYFVGLNGYPGPSGLYSAAIPVLDLLVHGGINIRPEEREQIRKNLEQGLYPYPAYMLEELLGQENPMLDMPDKNRAELTNELNAFRRIHRSSVKKFVPGAENGTADGSGGVANVPDYLDSKIIVQEKEKEND